VLRAVEKHPGAPRTVTLYGDNGPQYGSRAFMDSMDALGIDHEFIAYNTPEQDAYVESFHGRFKREYVRPSDFGSFQEADAAMAEAFVDYNQRRHGSSSGLGADLSNHVTLVNVSSVEFRGKHLRRGRASFYARH